MLQTKMTEILGIKYPIQCGTMQGISLASLVAPVANAGGLLLFAGGRLSIQRVLSG